jgi:hypothetical protein
MAKRWGIVLSLGLLIAACILAGCGPGGATPTPAQALRSTTVPTKPVEQVTPDAEVSFAAVADFSRLSSYRRVDTYRWKRDDGAYGVLEVTREVVNQPKAMHVLVRIQEGQAAPTLIEQLLIGGKLFVKYADGWAEMGEQADEGFLAQFGTGILPEEYLAEGKGQFVVKEIVETYGTRHYRFEKEAFKPAQGQKELVEATGDIWVSPEHNVYLLAALRLVAVDEEGARITIDLRSSVSQINQPLELKAPEKIITARPIPLIPIMPGATEAGAEGTTSRYTVKASPAEVAQFFREQMPKIGWQESEGSTADTLRFQFPGARCVITLKAQGAETLITVALTYE